MIHIGSRRTGQTKCGKPIARRWWVSTACYKHEKIAGLIVRRRMDPRKVATCPKCLEATKRRKA